MSGPKVKAADLPPLARIRLIGETLMQAPVLKHPVLEETMAAIRDAGDLLIDAVDEIENQEGRST